jgi:hypothetical protein
LSHCTRVGVYLNSKKKRKTQNEIQRNLLLLSRLANVSFAGKQKGGVDGPGNIIATCAD